MFEDLIRGLATNVASTPTVQTFLLAMQHAWSSSRLAAALAERWQEEFERAVHETLLVQLVLDGVGRRDIWVVLLSELEGQSEERGPLRAAYAELSRMPVPLSATLVSDSATALRKLLDLQYVDGVISPSLRDHEVVVLQARRIKSPLPQRRTPVGEVVAALDGATGLVQAMGSEPLLVKANADQLPGVLAQVREQLDGQRTLYIADGRYCDARRIHWFVEVGDNCLVRHRRTVRFAKDDGKPTLQGKTSDGQPYREEWGWVENAKRRAYVRRLVETTPDGSKDGVALVTTLLDPKRYPAEDVLRTYRLRWKLDPLIGKITEVYRLGPMLGTGRRATMFQAAFCFVFYNALQTLLHLAAWINGWAPRAVALEKLYHRVMMELTGWTRLVSRDWTTRRFANTAGAREILALSLGLREERYPEHWLKENWRQAYESAGAER